MRGVWTALVTPFNEKNEVDYHALHKILEDQVKAGITGVILSGTTGESPTLTKSEKQEIILFSIAELKSTGVKVIAGTGTNNTEDTVEFSRWAVDQGIDGLLVVTPYYNKPSQIGLEKHFLKIADQVSCEIILYNVPGRTGVSLTAETISRLASHPRITTIKEATGNIAFTSEIFDATSLSGRSIDVLSGDDATYLALLSVGAVGVISVASNLIPKAFVTIQSLAEQGRFKEARNIHQKYYPLLRDLFIESNPVPIKYAMSAKGFCRPDVRLPLSPLGQDNLLKLQKTLKRCEII